MAIFFIAMLLILNVILLLRIKDFFNPFTMMSLFFFLPMSISTLRLSGLQNSSWSQESYLMIFASIICWGLFPFCFLMIFRKKGNNTVSFSKTLYKLIKYSCVLFILIYFYENKKIFNSFFPIFSGDLLTLLENHSSSLSFWGIITKGSPLFCSIALRNYLLFKKRIDLFLFLICLVLPLTRISRLDIFFSLIAVFSILNAYNYINFKKIFSLKNISKASLLVIVFYFVFIVVGNFRTTHGNEYEVSTKEIFQYKGYEGPGEIFAWMYSYFCLPFEDSDRIIANNQQKRFYGQLSLSPVTNGVFLGHIFWGLPNPDIIYEYSGRFTNVFAVPTALPYFYLDLGVIGGAFGMLLYQLILIALYLRSSNSEFARISYSIFMAAFCLSSFQAFIMAAETTRMILLALIIFSLPKLLLRKTYETQSQV